MIHVTSSLMPGAVSGWSEKPPWVFYWEDLTASANSFALFPTCPAHLEFSISSAAAS